MKYFLLSLSVVIIPFTLQAQQFLSETYSKIISWEQTCHYIGYASVKVLMDINGTLQGEGFEMNVANQQINTGRYWFIRFFY